MTAQRSFVFRTQTSAKSEAPPEAVYDTITDLGAHLIWSGDRASDDAFKLLGLESSDARLDRKRGKPWEVHFSHRYDIHPDGAGSRIVYTETVQRVNYVPYWLRFWIRPLSRMLINRADAKQLANLARLAEERSGSEG